MNGQTKLGVGAIITGAVVAVLLIRQKPAFLWPIPGRVVTSPFGYRTNPVTKQYAFHSGVDLSAKTGTPVTAPADGNVTELFTNSTGGKQLVLLHDNGYRTGYAHLSQWNVKLNDRVTARQLIAHTGATGQVTGPHLHFVMRNASGTLVNPLLYLV